MQLDATNIPYRQLNENVRELVEQGEKDFELINVNGHRYIGAGLKKGVRLDVFGVPGNDLAAFVDGATVHIHNDAQDGVGNTMNGGLVVVEGDCGDVLGYGMRGGEVFVKGDVGYRVGIHMKSDKHRSPVVVAGGRAGDFLGEYMAGGTLVVLGLEDDTKPLIGDYCGTGIHGGTIYLRGEVDKSHVAYRDAALREAKEEEIAKLRPLVKKFTELFGGDVDEILSAPIWCVVPNKRKHGAMYVANP